MTLREDPQHSAEVGKRTWWWGRTCHRASVSSRSEAFVSPPHTYPPHRNESLLPSSASRVPAGEQLLDVHPAAEVLAAAVGLLLAVGQRHLPLLLVKGAPLIAPVVAAAL